MTKRTYKYWTEADNQYILKTMDIPAKDVARDLGRTVTSITGRRAMLRKQIADKRVKVEVPTDTQKPLNLEPYRLTDATLADFNLFNPVTAEVWEEENPSLWARIKAWFRRS